MNGAWVCPEDHPQQPSRIHRSHFLQSSSPLTALLRRIPQTGHSRAPFVADAPERSEPATLLYPPIRDAL